MYTQIGFYTYTDARKMARAYKNLSQLVTNATIARTRVALIFDAAQMDSKRVKIQTFTQQQMMGIASAASASSVDQELFLFISILLNTCGRAPALPPRVGMRLDPSLSIGEATWLVALSYVETSNFKNYLPPVSTSITPSDIGDAIYFMVEDFRKWESMITTLDSRMMSLLGHIKFKIKMGIPIDQFEKSLYLHASHLIYGCEDKFNRPISVEPIAHTVVAAETGDPLIAQFADRLKLATLPGPKFNFLPLISNAAPESLFVSYGPYPVKAVTVAGWTGIYEPFSKIQMKPMTAPMTITPDDHLLGLMAAGNFSRPTEINAAAMGINDPSNTASCLYKWNQHIQKITRKPTSSTGGGTDELFTPFILDIPEVDLIWHDNKVQKKYMSEVLGRPVITDEDDGILYEIARKHKQYGGSQSFRSSIDEFDLADISEIVTEHVISVPKMTVDVVYYSINEGKDMIKEVDLAAHFAQYGDKVVRPAFAKFLKPPLGMLELPQPAALDYIGVYLGLTEYERMMSSRAITICFNAFLLRTFFGQLPSTGASANGNIIDINKFAANQLFRKS